MIESWTPDDWVKIITALGVLVSALGAILAAVQSRAAKHQSQKNSGDIRDVHVSLNSRLTQLLASTAEASRAQGRREGADSTFPPERSV